LLTLKAMFDLPYRMVEGLAGSIVQLMGLALPIPDHTLLGSNDMDAPTDCGITVPNWEGVIGV